MLKAAIVIVTYQGEKWLNLSLASCLNSAPSVPVYVVDNASTDKTQQLIEKDYPTVNLIASKTNTGFAAGNNIGIKAALKDGAQAVLLLNQDAVLQSNTLPELIRELENDITVAAVQAGLYLPNDLVNSLGNCFHYLGFGYAGGNGLSYQAAEKQLPWLNKDLTIPYFSGAGVLIRSAALVQTGLLDEELFMYHEDLELSLRFLISGWRIKVAPQAKIIHHYETSRSLKQFYYMERNRWLTWLSYFKLPTLLLLAIPWLVSEAMLLTMAFYKGWHKEKLQAYLYCLSREAQQGIINRRRRLKKLKIVSDRQILGLASSKIEFQGGNDVWTDYVFNFLSGVAWRLIYFFIRW